MRKIWEDDEWVFDFFDSPTMGQLWWNGIEEVVEKSKTSVLKLTGKSLDDNNNDLEELLLKEWLENGEVNDTE